MTEKLPKAEVDYGPGRPHGDRCGVCRHFEPPRGCEIVAGSIEPSGWCKRFARRAKRRGEVLYDHVRSSHNR